MVRDCFLFLTVTKLIRFSLSDPTKDYDIIQTVNTTTTTFHPGGTNSSWQGGTEGWSTTKGVANAPDIHSFPLGLDTRKDTKIEVMTKFTVGAGLYNNQRIKGDFQAFPGSNEEKIKWYGQPRKYTLKITLNKDGTFEIVYDGLSLTAGKITITGAIDLKTGKTGPLTETVEKK